MFHEIIFFKLSNVYQLFYIVIHGNGNVESGGDTKVYSIIVTKT